MSRNVTNIFESLVNVDFANLAFELVAITKLVYMLLKRDFVCKQLVLLYFTFKWTYFLQVFRSDAIILIVLSPSLVCEHSVTALVFQITFEFTFFQQIPYLSRHSPRIEVL